jgi:uncharacterized membrane protein
VSLHFAEPWPVALGLLAAAALVTLVVLTYRSLGPIVDPRSRAIFLSVRLCAALLLLMLMLEPVLSRERLRTEDLTVVVLLDRSRSMSVRDSYGGRPRYQVAADFLNGPRTGLLPLLGDDFRVVPLAFDTEVRNALDGDVEGETEPPGLLTDLAAAIRGAGEAVPKSETVAVVLLTDGAENAGGDAREAARELSTPIFAVGFGRRGDAEETRKDLAILSVDAPETAFAENTVVAEVTVRSTGYDLADEGNRLARLVLSEGGEQILTERVEFTEGAGTVRVPLRFVPTGKGPHSYRAALTFRGDEAIEENNSRSFSLDVLDRRASVLYFDATLRWEAKFLRDFLSRDPAIDLTAVLHSGQGRLIVQGDTHGVDLSKKLPVTEEGFSKFDVVVLGDVEAAVLSRAQLELLRKRVEGGGGLLTIGGYNAYGPGGYAGTPLAEALPVFIDAGDGQRESEAQLSFTPQGRVHPMLSGLSMFFTGRPRPTLRGLTRVRKEKPGAQVLVVADADGEERESPVLVAHRYGEGRAVAFTGDTTWVWHRTPGIGGEDGLFRRFWGQIVRWLLEREPEVEQTGDPLVLFADKASYRIGERIRLRARARDAEGSPISDATLAGTVRGPGGEQSLEFLSVPRLPGHYEARLRARTPGSHRAVAKAAKVGTAEVAFEVEDASVEMDEFDLNDALLADVARISGGRAYHAPPTAEKVAEDIRMPLMGLTERQELSLSNTPLFFLLFVALVTAEWYLRRRRNLL